MLDRKITKTVLILSVMFFSILRLNAGINPSFIHDTSEVAIVAKSLNLTPKVPLHPSMESFIANYAEDNDELFEKIRQNKSNYLKTIDKVFSQREIPIELKYLAIVESQLKTTARSGVGAVGIWQFMPGTAKILGLKITSRYDERQHLWKSSVAAAKYLNELYDIFEDWLLVVAAYNSGPAPVLNAIKKTGSRNFWKLQNFLPKETRNHVKRFIATHYYFEGKGSLVTLGKAESEKYLRELGAFNLKNNSSDEHDTTDPVVLLSQWVAVLNNEENLNFILKK